MAPEFSGRPLKALVEMPFWSQRNCALTRFLFAGPLLVALAFGIAAAQSRGHILYGDLLVDEDGAPPLHSITFQLVLQTPPGQTVDRQTVTSSGRYRFMNVINGDYFLLVENENRVVARLEFRIDERRTTDIRKDIQLAWNSMPKETPDAAGGVLYARSRESEERLRRASQALGEGKPSQSRKILEKLLEDDPGDFEAWTELGSAHFQLRQFESAQEAYQRALFLRPEYFPATLNLGKLLLSQKKGEAAVAPLSQAVRLEPNSAEAQYFLGEAYLMVRKGSLAVEPLEAALRLEPMKMADVHLRLGALYEAAGMKQRAAAEYRRYLQKKPNSERASQLQRFVQQYGEPEGKQPE